MTSDAAPQDSNLVDLFSERHHMIQKIFEKAWNDQSDISISKSEWYIISKVYENQLPISHVTKSVDISRQATHKLIKNLSAKGLIEVHRMENNKKERSITLTSFGKECYEAYIDLKVRIEVQITERLGLEQVRVLKEVLQLDWGM